MICVLVLRFPDEQCVATEDGKEVWVLCFVARLPHAAELCQRSQGRGRQGLGAAYGWRRGSRHRAVDDGRNRGLAQATWGSRRQQGPRYGAGGAPAAAQFDASCGCRRKRG